MRLACFLILIVLSDASLAFRCGNQLVYLGDTRYEVEVMCGLPDDATRHSYVRSIASGEVVDCAPVPVLGVDSLSGHSVVSSGSCLTLVRGRMAVQVNVEQWLYDFGRNRFMQLVTFENGRVTRLDQLGYGKKYPR